MRVYLSLGSNLPDRMRNLRRAIGMIGRIPEARLLRESPIYETEPVGNYDNDFLNGVVEVMTRLDPRGLLEHLQEIERQLGRRDPRRAARTIDIDILLFGNLQLDDDNVTVPHPRMCERRFVLRPLCDLAPDVTIKGRTAQEWLDALGEKQRVERFAVDG